MKLTLDSNVLVYAADAESVHHLAAARLLRRAAAANCLQTLQSLGECFHVLRGKRRHGNERAREAVTQFQELFPLSRRPPLTSATPSTPSLSIK